MKTTIYLSLIALSSLVLFSCILNAQDEGHLIIARSEQDSERSNRLSTSKKGKCEEYRDCEDICEDVYEEDYDDEEENEGRVNTCLKLPYNTVIYFEEILDIIQEPTLSLLRNISDNYSRSFEEFLDVSVAPWVKIVKEADDTAAKDLLIWIAQEDDVSEAIISAYKNYEDYKIYEGVKNLFEEIRSGSDQCDRMCSAITTKDITGGDSFWDIATAKRKNEKNDDAIEIACKIVETECGNTSCLPILPKTDCPR